MLCLFTQRIHESRWLVGTLKMTLTICFCFPVPKVWSFFFFSLHRLWCLCTLWCHAHLAVMPTQTQLNGQGQEQIAFRIYKALLEVSTMYSRHRGRSLLQVEDAWASSWPYGWAQKMTFLQQQQGQRPGGQEGLVCVRNHTAFLAAGRHCTREKADQHRTSFQGV